MKKIFFVLATLTFIGGLAYFFSTSNLKGDLHGTNAGEILTISKAETGETQVDWSTTENYILGKWRISATQNVTVNHLLTSTQRIDGNINGLQTLFDNINLKVTDSTGAETNYGNFTDPATTLAVKITAGETYIFEVTGQPNSMMEEVFTKSYNSQEMRMSVLGMIMEDGTEYAQAVPEMQAYFGGDAYDEFNQYYANGGYSVKTMIDSSITAALTVTQAGSEHISIDWANQTDGYTLGEWTVSASQDLLVDEWKFFVGEPDKAPLENYFDSMVVHAENTDTEDYTYTGSDAPMTIRKGDWKFILTGIPKAGVDFSTLEASKVAMTIGQFTFVPSAPVDTGTPPDPSAPLPEPTMPDTTIYTLSNPLYAPYFKYDNKTFSFGGNSLSSLGYIPDESTLPPTRAMVLSIKEKLSGNNITGKIKAEDILIFGPNDATTQVTDAVVILRTSRTGVSTFVVEIPTESTTDEYSIAVAPAGFVAKGFGPYTTAIDAYTASTEAKTLIMEYAYYITTTDADLEPIKAVVTSGDVKLSCDDLAPGLYGCRVPFETSDLSYEVTAEGYDTINAKFTVARTLPSDSGEHVKLIMYPTGTSPAAPTTEPTADESPDSSAATGVFTTDTTVDESMTFDESPETSAPTGVFTPDTATEDTTSAETVVVASEERLEIMTDEDYECEDPFTDTSRIAASDLICRLYNSGIFSGKTSTTFEPYDYITRAEFLKIALLNSGYTTDDAVGVKEYLSDVKDSDWFSDYVKIAVAEKFISTSSGKFNPNEKITRADAIVLTMNIARQEAPEYTRYDIPFSDVKITDYFADAVMMGYTSETDEGDPIIGGYGDGSYKPGDYIRRYESASIIYRTYLALYE